MPNTSATGGYLLPLNSPAPLQDDALDAFLQGIVVGVTGLVGSKVKPRWQPEPPNLEAYGQDWCAIGVVDVDPDTNVVIKHDPTGNAGTGSDLLQRQEQLDVLASFYGPNANQNCGVFRDGIQIPQNREQLLLNGFGLVETTRPIQAPVLIKMRWMRRIDTHLIVRRQVNRVYQVLNLLSANGLLSAQGMLDTEVIREPFSVTGP